MYTQILDRNKDCQHPKVAVIRAGSLEKWVTNTSDVSTTKMAELALSGSTLLVQLVLSQEFGQ